MIDQLINRYDKSGYRFEVPENYIEQTEKKVLLLTHQFSRTGAPLALMELARILKKRCDVIVACPEEGEQAKDYLEGGIPIVYIGKYWLCQAVFVSFAKMFDIVVANTVLHFPAAILLSGEKTSVYWWIHEHEAYFEYGRGEIPNPANLGKNIHTLAAGIYVKKVIQEEFGFQARELMVGVRDFAAKDNLRKDGNDIKSNRDRCNYFICAGTYGAEKGQDIVVNAYRRLTDEEKEQIGILFIGPMESKDEQIFSCVQQLAREEAHVQILPMKCQSEYLEILAQNAGVIVASRREVFSMVAAEAMMLSKCVIISDACGIVSYLDKQGEEVFIFPSGQTGGLVDIMKKLARNVDKIVSIGKNARKRYDDTFSMQKFEDAVNEIIQI